jgi:hypothetical protein
VKFLFEIENNQEADRMYVMIHDKFDVRIIRTDEGVVVDIYPGVSEQDNRFGFGQF